VPDCRILVVGDNIFFTSVAALLARSEQSGLKCFAAADAIDAMIKIHEIMPHVVVADAATSNLWGVKVVPFIRRRFPKLSLVTIGGAARPSGPGHAIPHAFPFQDEGEAARLRTAIEDLARRRPGGN
jgi:hypothetical protein